MQKFVVKKASSRSPEETVVRRPAPPLKSGKVDSGSEPVVKLREVPCGEDLELKKSAVRNVKMCGYLKKKRNVSISLVLHTDFRAMFCESSP